MSCCDFIKDCQELVMYVCVQIVQLFGRCYNQIVDDIMVGFGGVVLYFEEFFVEDVGSGVFLIVYNILLQCVVYFREGYFLWGVIDGFYLSNQNVRRLNVEVQVVGVGWCD